MIKASLEKFDSPVVIINQAYESEDWGVIASYVSQQDVGEADDEVGLEKIGWRVNVILPSMDEVDFDQVFSTPETALEFGITKILGGALVSAKSPENGLKDETHPFGHYHSIV
ncbi:MAG: hypothetical protein ABFS39_02575 [Pseudomonadota bacterium]